METQEKAMIRIANKPRKRFEINSDSDEAPIEISSDNNDDLDKENEIEENEIEESETEKEAKIKMRQISAFDRHLRNAALPVRYRDR